MAKTQSTSKQVNENEPKKIRLGYLYLLILGILFFFNYSRVYDAKVSLMGDNITYLSTAKSLADGNGYRIQHLKDEPLQLSYPPLYPYVLSKFMKKDAPLQDSLQVAKKLNGFFLLGVIVICFLLFSRLTGNELIAFFVCALMLFNAHLLEYSFVVMSEMFYLFWSLLSIFFIINIDFKVKWYKSYYFFGALLAVILAYYTRTIGISLIGAVILYLLISKKWQYAIPALIVCFIAILPWYLYVNNHGESFYINQIMSKNPYQMELGKMESMGDWLGRIMENSNRYFHTELVDATFGIRRTVAGIGTVWGYISGGFLVVISIFGGLQLSKHKKLLAALVFAALSIVFLWPPVWFGPRFIIPLIPFLVLCFVLGMYHFVKWVIHFLKKDQSKTKTVNLIFIPLVILLLVFIYPNVSVLSETSKMDFNGRYKMYIEMANWVNLHVEKNKVVACRKPGLFYFFADRKVVRFLDDNNPEKVFQHLVDNGVDYILLDGLGFTSTSKYLYPVTQQYDGKFLNVHNEGIAGSPKTPMNSLYKLDTSKGYFGAYLNGEKSGEGTFTYNDGSYYKGNWDKNVKSGYGEFYWPDGKVFKGEWQNNKRHGKGMLFIGKSYLYKGTWVNDLMQGEFEVSDYEQNIFYKAFFKDNDIVVN